MSVVAKAQPGPKTATANTWIYVFGEVNGEDVKIGHTKDDLLPKRLKAVNAEQTTSASYRILAGVCGSTKDEDAIHAYFADWRRTDKGRKREYFWPSPEVVEYVNWLRSQWWVAPNGDMALHEMPIEDPSHWLPNAERRIAPPAIDPERLIQPYEDLEGDLAGTVWNWMVSPRAQVQDYFTPLEIVDAAREAMGDVDLDVASHWLANRKLRIPDYFHTGRSAFDNDWYGRVWLNPPYGNNGPWFERIQKYVTSGAVEQLCMISPMWAFQTNLAKPILDLTSAIVLLCPTPTFWGNSKGLTGTNQPHGIIYIGHRTTEFKRAFSKFGMTVQVVP